MKSIVYFTDDLSSNGVKRVFEKLNPVLGKKIAVKLHSGEKGNQNYIRPEFWQDLIYSLNGTVVECNTAYPGARNTTKKHRQLISEHEWDKYFKVELLDAEEPDVVLNIPNGKIIKVDYVGKGIVNYDSMLVLSHFKGHIAYINVMKNMSVDCDCCDVVEDPCMKDIGILASLDPIAVDQACLDLIKAAKDDPGQAHFLERVNSRQGEHTIEAAAELGFGSREYELMNIDE